VCLIAPRLLFVSPSNSYRIASFLNACQRLAVDVFLLTEGQHSLATQWAGGLQVKSLADTDNVLSLLAAEKFDAVLGSDDATVPIAATLATAMGLSSNDPLAARLSRRKDLARAALLQHALPVPDHTLIDLSQPLSALLSSLVYPCVLKPLTLSGSQGVIRVNSADEARSACLRIARLISTLPGEESHLLLAECYIPGVEVAVEGMLTAGKMELLACFDKPDPLEGPYFEETLYVAPSRLPAVTQQEIVKIVNEVCVVYGIRQGPVHAELRIDPSGKVWVLEVAMRTIGGLCAQIFEWISGASLEEAVIQNSLQRPLVCAERRYPAGGVMMIPVPKEGVLRRVEGLRQAKAVTHITEVAISVRDGYRLIPLPEGNQYLGFIFAAAKDAASVEHALRTAHDCLTIVVAPLWHVQH
jgi:biotin carboxylase